jgi:YD repeat-containing protein
MMKTIKKITLVLPLLILLASISKAQSQANSDNFAKMVDFMPPAPNAAAISKAGLAGLNKNTGAASVNIPIYTLSGRKISVNAMLSYNSSGIKVDETASRAGLGFSFNLGGVVTRTLRGTPDEVNPRRYPYAPLGVNWSTYTWANSIVNSNNNTGYDSEPDMFTFNCNGLGGSFVFDAQMNVVLIPSNNLKVAYNFSNGAEWNFKITGPDGIMYYFGGAQATEKTKRDQTCGKLFDQYIATSWYLKKTVHPNGETINFTYDPLEYSYDIGISETTVRTQNGSGSGTCPGSGNTPVVSNTLCKNIQRTQGCLLKQVSNEFGNITITYKDRPDCTDKLIDAISVRTSSNNLVKSFTFNHSLTTTNTAYYNTQTSSFPVPYLASVTEYDNSTLLHNDYQFGYIDKEGRPPRLSFAQDHWGYFNGRQNNTLLPYQDHVASLFPNATANREVDFEAAQKGMLCKIVYPTGGIDSIIYEPNMVSGSGSWAPLSKFTCNVTGTGNSTAVYKTIPFTAGGGGLTKINIRIICNAADCDPIHQKGTVQVKNASGNVLLNEVNVGGTIKQISLDLQAGNYTLELRANGTAITTEAQLIYYPATYYGNGSNTLAGGVRVKELLSGNPGETPLYKRYYYGELNSLEQSSMTDIVWPKYDKAYQSTYFFTNGTAQIPAVTLYFCDKYHNSVHSNSLLSLFDYGGSPSSYASVVESAGENFEGGGLQSIFSTRFDQRSTPVWGNEIFNAPFNNWSIFYNGKQTAENVFKKNISGGFTMLKQSKSIYKEDLRGFKVIPGYMVNQRNSMTFSPGNDTACISGTYDPTQTNFSCLDILEVYTKAYDVMRYDIFSPWVYLDSTKETLYDENGQNPVNTYTKYFYDNELHQQLTRTEAADSKGKIIETLNKYPHDYISQQPYTDMVNIHNIISPVINTKTQVNGADKTEMKNNFAAWGNGNYATASIESSIEGGVFQNLGTVSQYDAYGNITEYTGKDGVTNSIIWGYNYLYPVAKITGASYTQTSAQLGTTIAALQAMDGTVLLTQLNNLRTGLPQALITSYTYKPLTGVTTITDANGKTSTYEYDRFNRLKWIKDQDGNTVKTMSYNYAGSNLNNYMKLYFNEQQQQDFYTQNCPYGTAGAAVTYLVPASKYFSLISVADANAKAQAEILAKGQINANNKGYCSNDITACSGADKKMIGCYCEVGQIIPVSCSNNADGTWNQVYKYKWSDNSTSQNYTRVMPACTGVDKKKIGCECVTGIKVYTSSVQNATTGMWDCIYHWHWPDNTNSVNFTETSATNCFPEM